VGQDGWPPVAPLGDVKDFMRGGLSASGIMQGRLAENVKGLAVKSFEWKIVEMSFLAFSSRLLLNTSYRAAPEQGFRD
jgi:hypothetical protein